jgi:hypothetical protein
MRRPFMETYHEGGVVKAPFSISRTCGLVVGAAGTDRGKLGGFYPVVYKTTGYGVQIPLSFTHWSGGLYSLFSTARAAFSNLLVAGLCPVSTDPINTSTK